MAFNIVISGSPHQMVLCSLRDMIGADNLVACSTSLRIGVGDQASMVGVLNRLHDLGLEIELVERSAARV